MQEYGPPKIDFTELLRSVCPHAHEDIGAGEQHVKAVLAFPNPAVYGRVKNKLPLDDQKRVFIHAPYGRFTMFDLPLPVYDLSSPY